MYQKDQSELDIAPYIDHSLLDPTATPEKIEKCCEEADRYQFASVCVYPAYVRQAVDLLHHKKPKVCTVIGFPTGATTAATKLYEAQEAVDNGASELDVMINLGLLKAGRAEALHREIAEICENTGQPVKVILELGLLSDPEKRLAVEICLDAGVFYLKTHTGWFGTVKVEDIRHLREIAGQEIGIKASGGIKTRQQGIDLIMAGATRLGTSRGVDLVTKE
jgi:deoxyribose-phosphate aldolase